MNKKFKKSYFDSGSEFQNKKMLYKVKSFFFSNKNAITHYNKILLDRWKFLNKFA